MLTAEQIAIRATGIGASEVAALLELSPYQGPLDVWLRKPTPVRGPIIESSESLQSEVGSALEAAVLDLYRKRTGREVDAPHTTLRHPLCSHVMASPDGLVHDERRGVEVKVVGARMLHHWENESIPDYYAAQCHQNMAVMDFDRWDLVALLGGTDLRIVTLERDPEIESAILETCEEFWAQFIETNTPPPPTNQEEHRRYLRIRYPGSGATKCVELDSAEVREAIADYQAAHEQEKEAKKLAEATTLRLLELVGDEYGIEGSYGKFIAPCVAGRVNWQQVATQLAGGAIPADVIEQNRGEKYRLGRFYPPTTKTTTTKKRGRRS